MPQKKLSLGKKITPIIQRCSHLRFGQNFPKSCVIKIKINKFITKGKIFEKGTMYFTDNWTIIGTIIGMSDNPNHNKYIR